MGQSESLLQSQWPVLIPLRHSVASILHPVGLRLGSYRLYWAQSIPVSVAARLEVPTQVVGADFGPLRRELHHQCLPWVLGTEAPSASTKPITGVILSQRCRERASGIGRQIR